MAAVERSAATERWWDCRPTQRRRFSRVSIVSEFPTVQAMEQLAAIGREEGLGQAAGQIDAILAESPG